MTVVIDTGPDFRRQALRYGIRKVDAVLYSHHHFDHIAGMDDLRPYSYHSDAPIPCFARPNTVEVLRRTFAYVFDDTDYPGISRLELHGISGPISIAGRYGQSESIDVVPVEVLHGDLEMLGFRIGDFAYLTDTSDIPPKSLPLLEGLEILILDALREQPHPTHLTISEAVELARQLKARQTYFIHMTHSVLHAEVDAGLPDGINLGYDGLVIEMSGVD